MDLVDKKHVTGLQRGQKAGKVTWLVKHRAGRHLHIHSHLVGYDVREGGLSKARRPVKEHVVKGFAPHLGRLHIDVQIGHYLLLSGEIFQPLRADNSV